MTREAQPLTLSSNETRSLKNILTCGTASARALNRARLLDLLHRRHQPAKIAAVLQLSTQTVYNVKRRYLKGGLQAALFDKARSGRPVEIDGKQRARITALACSTPPEGRARWTLRLLADKAVELGYCPRLSHTAARQVLKKTLSSRI